MMINFKALEQEREIVMSINGVRETDEQRVDLDYKPRFKGGFKRYSFMAGKSPKKMILA